MTITVRIAMCKSLSNDASVDAGKPVKTVLQ